jgi:hypothetical protein
MWPDKSTPGTDGLFTAIAETATDITMTSFSNKN